MKRKILSWVLATTILATWLSATFANTENIISTTKTEVKKELTAEQKAKFEEYKRIKAKQKAGQTLTAEEQKLLDEFKAKKNKNS